VRRLEAEMRRAANLLKANAFEIADRTEKLLRNQRELEKEIDALRGRLAARDSSDLMDSIREIRGVRVLTAVVPAADPKALRDFGDKIRDRISSGVVLLGASVEGKAMLLCLVTKDLTARYSAGRIIKEVAPIVGGSGGGRPDMAQAGGPKAENLKEALARLETLL